MKTYTKPKITSLFFLTTTLLLSLFFSNLIAQTGPRYAGWVVNDSSSGTLAWSKINGCHSLRSWASIAGVIKSEIARSS